MPSLRLVIPLLMLVHIAQARPNQCQYARNYQLIRPKHKSSLFIAFWKRTDSLKECLDFARDKNGLAFNYGSKKKATHPPNCQVLPCPETGNLTFLVRDKTYNYYSSHVTNNVTNVTCVPNVGMFTLTEQYVNYTDAILSCQRMGGDLADVTSEIRTTFLTELLKKLLANDSSWYRGVFVGLDDFSGRFENGDGRPLICSDYRAWAPGHPPKIGRARCVALDTDTMWRGVKCDSNVKLKGLSIRIIIRARAPDSQETFNQLTKMYVS